MNDGQAADGGNRWGERLVVKRVTAELPVHYNREQSDAMHGEILDLMDEKSGLEDWWDSRKAEKKERETRIDTRSADLHKKLRKGFDVRDVMTLVLIDPTRPDVVQIVREDTGEIVKERVATKDEHQLALAGFEPTVGGKEIVEPTAPYPGEHAPPGAPRLGHDAGVIDAEFEDEVNDAGRKAHKDFTDGAPSEVYTNPYEPEAPEFARWQRGWESAVYEADYTKGYELGSAGAPLNPGDDVSDGFRNGHDAATAARAEASTPKASDGTVLDGTRPGAGRDETDRIVESLRRMSAKKRAAYFEDIDRKDLIPLYRRIVEDKDPGKTRSVKLIDAVLAALDKPAGPA